MVKPGSKNNRTKRMAKRMRRNSKKMRGGEGEDIKPAETVPPPPTEPAQSPQAEPAQPPSTWSWFSGLFGKKSPDQSGGKKKRSFK